MGNIEDYRLIVLAPTAPPGICGIGDYSFNIANTLGKLYKSVNIGVEKIENLNTPIPSSNISIDFWTALLKEACIDNLPTVLFLNYSPTAYSKIALPLRLLVEIKRFKKANPKNRVFILFHEIWNGNPNLPLHHFIKDKITQISIYQLWKMADALGVVTIEQRNKLRRRFNIESNNIYIGLIGANILPINRDIGFTSLRRRGEWVIFGLPHTRLWAFQDNLTFMKDMYKKGYLKKLNTIGPRDNTFAKQEVALANENFGEGFLFALGELQPMQVSEQLLCSEAAIISQTADSLNKSGSFASLAAHAVPIICQIPSLKEPFKGSIFNPLEIISNPNVFYNNLGKNKISRLHKWFWSMRGWDAISLDLTNWMKKYY